MVGNGSCESVGSYRECLILWWIGEVFGVVTEDVVALAV